MRIGNASVLLCAAMLAGGCATTAPTGGYAAVNGLRMYYEVHGPPSEVPLVLLHGGGSTIESTFGRVLPSLSRHRRVIAIEEQAHGRTSDRDTPVRFESSADDVAALLHQLGIARADFFGFSNGASVALQVAIRRPALVRKLVFASAMTKASGAHPWLWDFIRQGSFATMPQSLKDAFLAVNHDPAKLETMHDKDADRMRNFTDVPDEALAALRAQTLILIGDQDVVRPEHALELSRLIPNARLLILPGSHGDYLGELSAPPNPSTDPAASAQLVAAFLDTP